MIDVFYYSIAGKKTNQTINDLIEGFLSADYIEKEDKKILRHTLEVSEEGNYPSCDYYKSFYEKSPLVYRSLAEIKTYCKAAHEFYERQALTSEIISSINDEGSLQNLKNKILSLVDKSSPIKEEEDTKQYLYGAKEEKCEGIKSGIQELDEVTYGFQPGTIGFISAFTGEGKSTLINSIIFKNCIENKKSCILSLELAPELLWLMFEARYMYQVKGLQVTTQDFIMHKIPSDILEDVVKYEEDFKRDIMANLIILDESDVSKQQLLNYRALSALYRDVADRLGGLDILAVDHVGQFELMFPDQGNNIIKTYQSMVKTFKDQRGVKPVALMAVQANREGKKRATKRGGVYDLQAISDLNECASSHTVVHCSAGRTTYGSVLKKIQRGEHLTIKAYDYAKSQVVDTDIVDAFNTGTVDNNYEWRKLVYDGAPKDMIFTPTHRMLIDGNKVALQDLPNSFEADSIGIKLNYTAEQVLIGTLLGDSVISKTSKSPNGYHVRLLQGTKQLEYLKWKVNMLQDITHKPHKQGSRECYCASTISSPIFEQFEWTHTKGFKGITRYNLTKVNWIALLVWYLDDGCLVQDSKNSYHCVFSCTNFGEQGAKLMQERLCELGLESSMSIVTDKRSSKKQIQIRLRAEASRLFMSKVAHLIDVPCIEYKLKSTYKNPIIPQSNLGLCKTKVTQEVFKFPTQAKVKLRKKYNFTVALGDHNYALPGGVLTANCERSGTYVIFLYSSDDMKVMGEVKLTMAKHRLGSVITEPVTISFNPAIMTVGEAIESAVMTEDDFNNMGVDFGSMDEF